MLLWLRRTQKDEWCLLMHYRTCIIINFRKWSNCHGLLSCWKPVAFVHLLCPATTLTLPLASFYGAYQLSFVHVQTPVVIPKLVFCHSWRVISFNSLLSWFFGLVGSERTSLNMYTAEPGSLLHKSAWCWQCCFMTGCLLALINSWDSHGSAGILNQLL